MPDAAVPAARPAAGAEPPKTLIVGCGALARELLALVRAGGWDHVRVTCLPAKLHNRPERIPARLALAIRAGRAAGYRRIVAAFADCGTGGAIDRVLAAEGAARIAGPHCYAFYAGQTDFARLMAEAPGTFFLTDYLVRHFDALIVDGMGLDRHPRMRDWMFGNYRRVVWLAQSPDPALAVAAERAAGYLGLPLTVRRTGMGELAGFVAAAATGPDLPVPGPDRATTAGPVPAAAPSAGEAAPPAAGPQEGVGPDDRPDDRPPRPRRTNARRSSLRRQDRHVLAGRAGRNLRSPDMAELIVVSWRAIPSQVIARRGRRDLAKVLLSERFQDAIDRAAMRGQAAESERYLEAWTRSEPAPCGDDLTAEARAAAARLEADWDNTRLRACALAGGWEPVEEGAA